MTHLIGKTIWLGTIRNDSFQDWLCVNADLVGITIQSPTAARATFYPWQQIAYVTYATTRVPQGDNAPTRGDR